MLRKQLQHRKTISKSDEVSCSLERTLGLKFVFENVTFSYDALEKLVIDQKNNVEAEKVKLNQLITKATSQQKEL